MNNNLNILILIFFFLLVQISFCIEENLELNPILVENASYIIKYNYTLRPSSGNLSKATITISIPSNSTILSSSHNYSIIKDEWGNNFLVMSYEPSSPSVNFSAELFTTISASHIYSLNNSNFYYDLNNPFESLRELSLNITSNYSSDFEKIAALAIYVHNLLDYDLNFADKTVSPQQILQIKKGVCWHYSLLFSSLAQSLGYKTRYVHGFAYSSKAGGWIGHVWVEVYLGEWVGVDPTWLEVGFIDATHIPFFKSQSLDFKLSSATAYIEKDSDLKIISHYESEGFLEKAKNIVPLTLNLSKKNYIKNIIVSNEVLSPNSKLVIIANLSDNKDYIVNSIRIHSCRDKFNQSFFEFSTENAYFILQPSKEFYFYWIGKINQDFEFYNKEKNSYYVLNCPIIIEDMFGQSIIKEIEINPTLQKLKEVYIQPLKLVVDINQQQQIVVNSNLAEEFFLVSDNIFLSNKSSSPSFNFYPSKLGENRVVVFSKYSEPAELIFYVQKIQNLIRNLSVPKLALSSSPFILNITFNENLSNSNLTFIIQFANYYKQFKLTNTSLSLDLETDKSGEMFILFYLKDENGRVLYSDYVPIKVIQRPVIIIEEGAIKQKNNLFYINLKFNYTGNISYSELYLDEQRYVLDIAQDNLEVVLPKKPELLKLIWYDSFNNSYVIIKNSSSLKFVNLDLNKTNRDKNSFIELFNSFDTLHFLLVLILAFVLFIKLSQYYKNRKENSNNT